MEERKKIRRIFHGTVVSDAMDKSVVVRVDRLKVHPKYGKRIRTSKKYNVHDEKNRYSIGDEVDFTECRPLSRQKRWRVLYGKEAGSSKLEVSESTE